MTAWVTALVAATGHDAGMEVLLAMLGAGSAVAAVLLPPVFLVIGRRHVLLSPVPHLGALAAVAAWVVAGVTRMEWADRTGGRGSVLAGTGWLLLAVVAAAASVVAATRRPPVALAA